MIQFGIAMVGSVIFAVMAADKVGGMTVLLGKIQSEHADKLSFLPDAHSDHEVWAKFMVFVLVMWWANQNADGGGGIIIQRMLSAKNERHALVGTFWGLVAGDVSYASGTQTNASGVC